MYRVRIFIWAVAVLLLSTCCHCSDKPTEQPIKELDTRVIFSLVEMPPCYNCVDTPSVKLILRTEKEYGCFNWSIDETFEVCGSELTLEIHGIHVPDVCLDAFGPATAAEKLELHNGIYTLSIENGDFTDQYAVSVTDSTLGLLGSDSTISRAEHTLFWRYPENSFVYLCGTTTETSWMCDDFLDSLHEAVTLTEFTFPDTGRTCYPRSSAGHYFDAPARYFYYNSEADFDTAGELLARYARDIIGDQQGIGISLHNWKNKAYRSWMMGY